MLNYVGIKQNSGYILYVGLVSQADTKIFQVNPTIASGDFKVSIDGGAFADLGTLPVVTPAGGRAVKITLSAGEMNGTNIFVQCVDAAGAEWCAEAINIQTTPVDASLVQIDGTANSSATLNLKKLNVVNSAGDAAVFSSTGSNGTGINASGNGSGAGILTTGGATGHGMNSIGGSSSGSGIVAEAATVGGGIYATGRGALGNGFTAQATGTSASGISATGATSGSGIVAVGGLTGSGIGAFGGATSGPGIYASAVGAGNGISAIATGGGNGLFASGNGNGSGITGIGGATAQGIYGQGGSLSGAGAYFTALGSGVGMAAVGVGSVSILAAEGISGPFDTATYNAMADAALVRNWLTTDTSTAPTNCTINALRANRNWAVSGSTYTAYKENGTTPAWTATLTTDAAGLPVVGFDSN